MSSLTDQELRSRLKAHNYDVPPITATTRALLVKKLATLDAQAQPKASGSRSSKKGKFTCLQRPM